MAAARPLGPEPTTATFLCPCISQPYDDEVKLGRMTSGFRSTDRLTEKAPSYARNFCSESFAERRATVTLSTEDSSKRTFLRVLEASDIQRTQAWINQPEIGEIMGYLPRSLQHQEEWFSTVTRDSTKFIFAICRIDTKEHIGNVALGRIDYINRNAMLSIFIARESERGNGAGSEALTGILDFAFFRLNLHRVYLQTSLAYPGAVAFYEKHGFSKEGVLRQQTFHFGTFHDKHIYGILREEFIRPSRH